MSSPEQQLWQIIRTREKSLAATREYFATLARQEQTLRLALEADITQHRELLVAADQQAKIVETDRRREAAAKEQALKSLHAEVAAHRRWEKLCHEAEAQIAHLKQQVAAEATAKVAASQRLKDAELRIRIAEGNLQSEAAAKEQVLHALKAESTAHQRWAKLCHEAEAQLAQARRQVTAEAGAKEKATHLKHLAEKRVAAVSAERDQEIAAKAEIQRRLQAEVASHRQWEKLCQEAEAQLAVLKQQVTAEAVAKVAANRRLADAEKRIAAVAAERDREIAARAQTRQALESELAAHQRWEKLCREAEAQITALKRDVTIEAAAKIAASQRLVDAERRVAAVAAERDRESSVRAQTRQALEVELAAHQRWEKLCREAEAQIVRFKDQVAAEAAAKVAARQRLAEAEQRVATVAAERDREIAAKADAQHLLHAEISAHRQWEELCHQAEVQIATLQKHVAAEASAKQKAAQLRQLAEQRVAAVSAERDREIAAKAEAQRLLQAEVAAHQRWEKLCREAEAQIAVLKRDVVAEAAAKAAASQRLADAEQRVTAVTVERDREITAKAEAQRLLQAELAAHQRWAKLCRQAEAQIAALKEDVAAEAAAKASASQRLADAERRIAAVSAERDLETAAKAEARRLLEAEVAAHRRWEKLCREAEAQIAAFKKAMAAEALAKATAYQRLAEVEERVVAVSAERDREIAAKAEAQRLLQAELAAHRRWEKLCQAAEAQIAALKRDVAAEAAAKAAASQRLADAEQRVVAVSAERDQEIAAKAEARRLLEAEVAAHRRWEKLCQAAEAQIITLQANVAAEAAAKTALNQRLTEAEQRIRVVITERDREIAAHGQTRQALDAEFAAHRRWEKLSGEAEVQIAALRNQVAAEAGAKEQAQQSLAVEVSARQQWEALCHAAEQLPASLRRELDDARRQLDKGAAQMRQLQADVAARVAESAQRAYALAAVEAARSQAEAEVSALTTRLAQADFALELAAEQRRHDNFRHSGMGRWLGFRNATVRALRRLYCWAKMKPFVPAGALTAPRIAQVNTHDLIGGAERTSYDLHVQYRQRGLRPSLTVGGKKGQDDDVFAIPFKPYDWEPAAIWRDRWGLTEVLYPTPVKGVFEWPHLRQAHVVHIHNMHGQYWNSATLLPLGMQHPLVITLHDEHTLTGDCCYSYDCERWLRGCGKCPQIGLARDARYALGGSDLTRLNIHLKRALFRAPRAYPLVIVTPSRWLAERARRSPNLRHLPIISINNGVDLDFWRPQPQADSRHALGLPLDKTIALVVANHLSDRRKGFDCVLAAIRLLPCPSNLLFVVVGNITEELKAQVAGLPVVTVGYVRDKATMRNLFSACDVTLSMSRSDNLPYMCIESLACGRPVFGSAVGGIPEIINDPQLGWLASLPFNHQSIATTLAKIDGEPPLVRGQRFIACRRSAEARFSLKLMVERYLNLYQEMLCAAQDRRIPNLTKLVREPRLPS